jgi:hypothetical protein
LEVEVMGTVQRAASGYVFKEIVTRAHLSLPNEGDHERAICLLHKAQELCLIGRSLSVDHKFEPGVSIDPNSAKPRTNPAVADAAEQRKLTLG